MTTRTAEILARRIGLGLGVVLLGTWSLAPAVWQVLTALKPDVQITATPTVYLPRPATLAHVEALWVRKPFATFLVNSAIISGMATLVSVSVGALAAAALTGLKPHVRDRVLIGLLLVVLFPPILLLFPLYEGVRWLGWLNHPLALILPYAALSLPLSVWILESGLRAIPSAIDEAAILDGLGPISRLARIHLPLAAPSVTAAVLLVFMFCWNEFMLAVTFMPRETAKTVTAGIASVGGSSIYEIPWGQLSAAVVIATTPLVLLVLLFERRIVAGLTRGAVKG
ncbi:MAG: carbohydrate ABC transporter permease [Vicinamibacterales bacterium]